MPPTPDELSDRFGRLMADEQLEAHWDAEQPPPCSCCELPTIGRCVSCGSELCENHAHADDTDALRCAASCCWGACGDRVCAIEAGS